MKGPVAYRTRVTMENDEWLEHHPHAWGRWKAAESSAVMRAEVDELQAECGLNITVERHCAGRPWVSRYVAEVIAKGLADAAWDELLEVVTDGEDADHHGGMIELRADYSVADGSLEELSSAIADALQAFVRKQGHAWVSRDVEPTG